MTRRDERPAYDEAFGEAGAPRPHYARLLAELDDPGALRAEALRRLGARGVTFGEETASFDPVPRILTEPEYAVAWRETLRDLLAEEPPQADVSLAFGELAPRW